MTDGLEELDDGGACTTGAAGRTFLPQAPADLPRRGDAFAHWKKGVVYVVTGVSRSEASPGEFNIHYLHEGVSEEEMIPWSRARDDFMGYVPAVDVARFRLEPEDDVTPVRRFLPIGRREIPAFIRPKVAAFARAMEEKLRKHEAKGGWEGEDPYDLIARVVDETDELDVAVEDHKKHGTQETTRKVLSEAADVANFTMFVADVCGALGSEPISVWRP